MNQEQINLTKEEHDIADLKNTIEKINNILTSDEFDILTAKEVIQKVNYSYPENFMLYNMFTYGSNAKQYQSSGISVEVASKEGLIEDLVWKRFYLSAKLANKAVDTIKQEWQIEKQKMKTIF